MLLFQEMELLEASFYGQRKKVWVLLQQKVAVNCINQVEYAYTIGSQTQREYYCRVYCNRESDLL